MTRRPDEFERRDGTPADDTPADRVADEVLRAIAAPPPAPDLTGPIMGRLGYMHAAPAVVKRRRRRRTIMRGVTCLMAGGVIGAALYVHAIGPDARRARGTSIPDAFWREVELRQSGFDRAIQTIRGLTPVFAPAAPGDEPGAIEWEFDEDADRSAIGPVRCL